MAKKKSTYPKFNGMMTVAHLKKLLEKIPEDTVLVTHGSDHSYDPLSVRAATLVEAEYVKSAHYFGEYYGDLHDPESEVIKVVVIGSY